MKDTNLFRFEVFASSKQLGDALALLSGRVAQITPPQLVANAKPGRGGNGVTKVSGERLVEMFGDWLRQHKLREFTTSTTREFLQSIGRAPQGASYLQTQAREKGLIKNVGDGATTSRWRVLGMKAAAKRKPTKTSKRKPPAKRAAASATKAE